MLASRAFMRPYLRCLRADLRHAETYRYPGAAGLDCPVTAMVGDDDTETVRAELPDWALETSGPFRLAGLPGGHFNLRTHRAAMVAAILRELS